MQTADTLTTDTPARFAAALRKLSACEAARTWATGLSYATAWNTCTNPDWLLWLLEVTQALSSQTNELLVCAFACEVLHLNSDPRVLACIKTREAWARGEASNAARAAARVAAWDAAGDAALAAARVAARAAARAAARDAAGDAAWAAARAAARDAAWVAAGDAARDAALAAARDAARAAARAAARVAAGDAAWAAARDAAGDAAWAAARAKQCEIIRHICPMPALA